MVNNFWLKLKKPFLSLAPMAGFSDSVFRQICQDYGADVIYSEMASATALYYNQEEKSKTLELLKKSKKEKNYVVQLFGGERKHFPLATKIISEKIKPDGIDINCGCPVSKVIKQRSGAYLMKEPKRAREIIKSVIYSTDLPVSIKIRKEAYGTSALDFIDQIADLNISAIMIHGRSLSQGFSGPIDYSLIKRIKKYFPNLIIANGGIYDLKGASETLKKTDADGLGLARGVLSRPWLFSEIKKQKNINFSQKQLFNLIIKHSQKSENIVNLRKHLCFYMQNIPQASYYRQQLVKAENASDIKEILKI